MCLSLLPVTALAADPAEDNAPVIADTAPAEDASVQRGEYSAPAQTETAPEQEPEPEPETPEPVTTEPETTEPEPQRGVPQPQGAGNAPNEGRASADQQVMEVNGKQFILLGTPQQLEALDYYPQTAAVGDANSDQITESRRYDVTGPIWRVTEKRDNYRSDDWYVSNTELVYPGDNNLTGSFASYPLYGENDCITDPNHGAADTHKLGETVVTREETHFLITYDMERDYYVGGTMDAPDRNVVSYDYGKYSPRNNYVVFRDIDLNSENWTPLMFYGLMYGVKGSELTDTTLADAVQEIMNSRDYEDYASYVQPVIQNISVNTALENRYANESQDRSVLLPDKYVGVGFFASVTSARPGSDSGLTHTKTEVRNLRLENVDITNSYSSIFINETLVSWLTTNLGSGVGYLLDFLLRLLTGKSGTDFANSVRDLLTARAKDPTNFATGSFAGRIYGDVLIENCDVAGATVNSEKSYVGGFVGYSTGAEQYDLVSESLGSLLKLLKTILNLIPGLGLGDLISIVQNVLPLNTLVPVNYLNPHIEDCELRGLSGSLGPSSLTWNFPKNSLEGLIDDTVPAQFNGGFIGCKVATVMINCGVHDSDYTVYAKEFGGGFAGLARDAVIQELLTDLGINLGVMKSLLNRLMDSNIDLQSIQVRCNIIGSDVTVSGENYLGGFNGAMTNAYCINNEMRAQGKTLTVNGTGDCVGGFAGIATLGWAMSMGQGEANGNTSLLSTLKNVVASLTSSYGSELLSLLGVGQSEILGLQFDYSRTANSGEGASVTGYDFVGGLVGKADALIMTGTTAANLSRMTYFQHGDLTAWDVFPNMSRTEEYTVTFHYLDGSTTTQTVSQSDNFTLTLPNGADMNGYTFVGWTTEHIDHAIGEPSDLLLPGESYLVTRDTTFNALYSIEGETVWELLAGTPASWEEEYASYIVTFGRDDNMVVLTGLKASGVNGTSYESTGSGGAKTIAQIRSDGGDNSLFTLISGIMLSNVPNLYLFEADKVLGQSDVYFRGLEYGDYLGFVLSKLVAYGAKEARTQWHPRINADLSVLFESDYGTGHYLVYDPSAGYFKQGTQAEAEANKLYIWGETKLPTRYTTVDRYTIRYYDMFADSVSQEVVTVGGGYTTTLPTCPDHGDYHFEGWVPAHYDHVEELPAQIYAAGSSYTANQDITLNALYSKVGDMVYELLSGSPEDWATDHDSYLITSGFDENMAVLKALSAGASYESASSGGASSIQNIRESGDDETLFTVTPGVRISNVTTPYLFTAQEDSELSGAYTLQGNGAVYLGETEGELSACGASGENTRWNLSVNTDTALMASIPGEEPVYLVYDSETAGFRLGTQAEAEAGQLRIWGEGRLPTRYTTVQSAEDIPQEAESDSLSDAIIGDFAKIHVKGLELVNGHKYVGGIAGLAGTANVSGLLNDTIGVGDFKKFEFSDIESIGGTELTEGSSEYGLKVYGHVEDKSQDSGAGFYVGGGVGMAIGGDLFRMELTRLAEIDGANCVGGFGGCVGPGDLISTSGLNVQLLGLSLLSANKLLSVGGGVLTDARTVTVQGVPAGFTVQATGVNANGSQVVYTAGGFYGRANSSSVRDGHVENLLWVKANKDDGRAGGFVGVSEVGGLASVDSPEGTEIKSLLSAGKLLEAVGYLIPDFSMVDTTYVNGGYVEAAWAGGFAADFQSGTVDNSGKASDDWYAVYNIDRVTGTRYAGGFGAKLYSGALADVGGGISILGGISNLSIGVSDFLSLVQAYVPTVSNAGVKSFSTYSDPQNQGFTVECTGYDPNDKTTGAAGGFLGYASGAQISRCNVLQLRHTVVTEPEELDGKDGTPYFTRQSSYAVSGTRYGGGYAGFLDIGSSASLGGGLNALGSNLNLTNLLGALDVVISTVEHSTVTGGPGGFAVKASAYTGGNESGSGTSASGESASEPDEITVYVVDNTPTETLWAYIFNSETDSHDGSPWHGHKLESLGTDRNGSKYYSFTVDRSLYNRVIFNDGGEYQTDNSHSLHLDNDLTLSKLHNGILTVSNNTDTYWYVTAVDDIWPDSEAVESCRGSYKHYVSVRGAEEYVETVTDESASHSYGPAVHVEGTGTHTHVCTVCGYREIVNCDYGSDGICTECGAGRSEALPEGRSGGFVGWMKGSHIQDSHADNFSHIIGMIAAGGYAGEIEPGNVADVAGGVSVLQGAVKADELLSVARDFVPSIRNSTTKAIPCGGVVRAEALSDAQVQRGMAGGYVGHNLGGQIWGNNRSAWKDENEVVNNVDTYKGDIHECAAIRILSVYGAEYAGGFTGLMEAGSTAGTGNVSLLFDLVKLNNLLSALKVSYPTEENTAVYGPLAQMDPEIWNGWVEYVGQYGGYGMGMPYVNDQTELDAILDQYLYGFHVTAGRDSYENLSLTAVSGCAGGYVGSMRSGTITNGQAHDVKQVRAMRNAGGFAGDMKTGSVANLGQASVLGLDLNLGQLLGGALQVFVPVVKDSSVHGYQNGMSILAFGDSANGSGNAGGFAGNARGAQIWGDAEDTGDPELWCNVYNLKKVQGSRYVGGYIGILGSGTTAEVGTNVSEGPLQDLLDAVVKTGGDNATNLLSLVNATVSTVRKASVTVADPEWGFTVGGWTESTQAGGETVTTKHVPLTAGGFVGTMEGAIIGNDEDKTLTDANIKIQNLRGVEAQYYAGGFLGVANEGSAASLAEGKTNLLSLANLGNISALDIFRPYIYNSDVSGVAEGFTVRVSGEEKSGTMNSTRYSGCAGGFGGALLDGHVENAHVTKLNEVQGLNYAGGFIGHCGKGGVVDADSASLVSQANLLNAQAGVGDVMGSRVVSSTVSGIDAGYVVRAAGGSEAIAGGFVGFADLAKIGFKPATITEEEQALPCTASNLKLVISDQIAGGFIGKTTKGFLVELQASSVLLAGLLTLVNELLELLYFPELQSGNGLNLNILGKALSVSLLDGGNTLGVTLLGIPITVSLSRASDTGDSTDLARITLGDSYIELPCNEDGLIDPEHSNLNIGLIPAFYTTVKNSSVTGIDRGFDVFAGGAEQDKDGTHRNGYAGGFVAFNQLGEIVNCEAVNCDVARGSHAKLSETATDSTQRVGPFTGHYTDESNYSANGQSAKETGDKFNNTPHTQETPPAAPFETDAKVKLMEDTLLLPNLQSMTPETAEMQNPCLPTVDLTLHKIWNDMDGSLGLRANSETPVSVQFTVTRVAVDKDGNPIADVPSVTETVTLTAEDANPFTPNVWTKQLTGKPASGTRTVTVDGTAATQVFYYRYSVTEAAVTGYISGTAYADADTADKLSFDADKTGGYVAKITNQSVSEQTVVVDFGLPVSVSVVDYLKMKYGYPADGFQVAGLLPESELNQASIYSTKDSQGDELLQTALDVVKQENNPTPVTHQEGARPQYGSFRVPAKSGGAPVTKLTYVPGSMMFDKPISLIVALQNEKGANYYTKLTVVPASNIYYEEDFISFTPDQDWEKILPTQEPEENGQDDQTPDPEDIHDGEQDEDRPGLDLEDYNSVYGYDREYNNSSTYSLGTVRKVHMDNSYLNPNDPHYKQWPTAQFTFTGTGFDLLSVTSGNTGYFRVFVYEGTEVNEDKKVATWSVDSFYGFQRSASKSFTRYYCVWDKEAHVWRVAKQPCPGMETKPTGKENGIPILDAMPAPVKAGEEPEITTFIYYREDYNWQPAQGESETLYQVPVISSMDRVIKDLTNGGYTTMSYGTYTVVVQPLYSSFFDHTSEKKGYDVYIDGVRIYTPAQNLDTDYYLQDHEGWPQFLELRNLLLGQGSYGSEDQDESQLTYCVMVDGIDGSQITLDEFKQYGPNNEIYLEPGQAIAFKLTKGSSASIDQIHISAKKVFQADGNAALQVASIPGDHGEILESSKLSLNTSSECYYDFSDFIRWNGNESEFIRIANTGSAVVSLRSMKVTYQDGDALADDLVGFSLLSSEDTETILDLLHSGTVLPVILDELSDFAGASVSLESDFSLHFYVPESLLVGAVNPYVVFTKQTAEGEVTVTQYAYEQAMLGDMPCRMYSFGDISAAEMGREVTARLFYRVDDQDHMSQPLSYSVRQYAENMLEKTQDQDLRTLLVDMLNYGAEAQQYFGVDPEHPVNADLTAEQQAWATQTPPVLEDHSGLDRQENAQVWFEGCSLSLERRVTLNYYLDLSTSGLAPEDLALRLSWTYSGANVHETLIDGSDFEAKNLNGRQLYLAILDSLDATQMRTVVSAELIDKSTGDSVSDTLRYSIESYAQSKAQEPGLSDLVLAMMKFGDAAQTYFSRN